jgi:hypothetical protein
MTGSSSVRLKAFKEIEKMAIAVTYVITATSFFTYNEDTATVVIAVGI